MLHVIFKQPQATSNLGLIKEKSADKKWLQNEQSYEGEPQKAALK